MPVKIGINGMGRIGRMVVRSIYENYKGKVQIKHINNRSSSEVCMNLLKYDSVHGKFKADIKSNESNLKINNHKVSFSQFSNIQDINWKKYTRKSYLCLVRKSLINKLKNTKVKF